MNPFFLEYEIRKRTKSYESICPLHSHNSPFRNPYIRGIRNSFPPLFIRNSYFLPMIKNIIFDLGGVLLNLDMEQTRTAFLQLGMKNFDDQYPQAKQSGIFDLYDCGKISSDEFRSELKKQLPQDITDEQIDTAWNAMLKDLPAE